MSSAAERYKASAAAWQQLAGNIPAPWVLSQRDRIRATAQLQAAVAADEPGGVGANGGPVARPASLMAAITQRAAGLRIRTGGERLPLLLDEPLADLAWDDKAPVLEFLGRLAHHQQVVLVTADTEVLSWARLEAMTGSVGLTAVLTPDDQHLDPRTGKRRGRAVRLDRRRRHLAWRAPLTLPRLPLRWGTRPPGL